jgi:autoinducer 2-degrading protein
MSGVPETNSSGAVHVIATWKAKAGQLNAVLALLAELVRASRAESGNRYFHVHRHNADPNILVLIEEYRSEAALAAHRNSDHYQTIVVEKIIPLLESRDVLLTTPLEL